jgi:protein CpxP
MVEQNNISQPDQTPPRAERSGRRGTFLIAILAVALLAALGGSMLSSAFGQPFGWHHGWRGGGMFGGPLTPAQVDERIDRITKHMAIELDASADQQARIATIAKTAVADLRPMREKALAARAQALALLTAPTVDRTAIERLRVEQIALADAASKRIAQALTDASEVLSPDQRRKIADWAAFIGPLARWHRG